MKLLWTILFFNLFLLACDSAQKSSPATNPSLDYNAMAPIHQPLATEENPDNGAKISHEELLGLVQNAIIPEYKNWLVFKHGTYVVFDNIDTIPDVQHTAKQWLSHYKPKKPEDNNWAFSITDLDKADAWSVFGNGYGIYTIVHAQELSMAPDPQQIGAYAKSKRALDEKNPQIIYISNEQGIKAVN